MLKANGYWFAEANLARPPSPVQLSAQQAAFTPHVSAEARIFGRGEPVRVASYPAHLADGRADGLVTPSFEAHQREP